jgi:hypothetical protein
VTDHSTIVLSVLRLTVDEPAPREKLPPTVTQSTNLFVRKRQFLVTGARASMFYGYYSNPPANLFYKTFRLGVYPVDYFTVLHYCCTAHRQSQIVLCYPFCDLQLLYLLVVVESSDTQALPTNYRYYHDILSVRYPDI